MKNIGFGLLLTLCLAAPRLLPAQSNQPDSVRQDQNNAPANAATPAPITPAAPARVIDVDEARRKKEREHRLQPWDVPLYPFILMSRGMNAGLLSVDRHHLVEKANYYLKEHHEGVLPLFGGLGEGTGLALGVKYYRNDFIRTGGHIEVPFRLSTGLSRQAAFVMSVPFDSGQHFWLDTMAQGLVRNADEFFGFGNNSQLAFRSTYSRTVGEFYVGPRINFTDRFFVATHLGLQNNTISNGRRPNYPGILNVYSPATVPGLSGARLWTGSADIDLDTRDVPGHPHRGGFYRVGAGWFGSADSHNYSWWRYYGDAQQYVPLGQYRTLALRAIATTNLPHAGSDVPFFEQASLGGSHSMRAYHEFRFHDRTGAMGTAEYRYSVNQNFDFLVFIEEGQVARTFGDMRWSGWRPGFGGGFRLVTPESSPLRFVIGQGREGTYAYVSLNTDF